MSQVKDGFDTVTAELAEHKEALSHSRLKEKQSAGLIQELTTMVKEQKTRIADITKAKQETISSLKVSSSNFVHILTCSVEDVFLSSFSGISARLENPHSRS